ncbi:helix-turn-helix domain-containing protein [Actinomadura rudentiformis]|nr:helix-turn-helix transcriptional regulator [Actinomadura rudentiformis]
MRLLLGTRLRLLREQGNVSVAKAAAAIRGSQSKISRMERGHVGFKTRDITDLLPLYGVIDPARREEFMDLARQTDVRGWWHDYSDIVTRSAETYLGLEHGAALIRTFDGHVIPDLLQTPAYAHAALRVLHPAAPDEEVERRVRLLMCRQQALTHPEPLRLWAVLDEACLRRPLGDAAGMHAQVRHLIQACEQPNITIQVIPFSRGGHAGRYGPVTTVRFDEPELPDMVYLQQLIGSRFTDQQAETDRYLELMNEITYQALPPQATPMLLNQILHEAAQAPATTTA